MATKPHYLQKYQLQLSCKNRHRTTMGHPLFHIRPVQMLHQWSTGHLVKCQTHKSQSQGHVFKSHVWRLWILYTPTQCAIPLCLLMSTSQSWGVNAHTTCPVSLVLKQQLMSRWHAVVHDKLTDVYLDWNTKYTSNTHLHVGDRQLSLSDPQAQNSLNDRHWCEPKKAFHGRPICLTVLQAGAGGCACLRFTVGQRRTP